MGNAEVIIEGIKVGVLLVKGFTGIPVGNEIRLGDTVGSAVELIAVGEIDDGTVEGMFDANGDLLTNEVDTVGVPVKLGE